MISQLMSGDARLEELRRRVRRDPASIAFAQLAEELRRAGQYLEAVDVCRTGLSNYPAYLSARVTLGRALISLDQIKEAQQELEHVRRSAPENLAAIRALADIHRLAEESNAVLSAVAQSPAGDAPAATPPGSAAGSDGTARTRRTIAALQRWLDDIHVARSHRRT
jgi:predicted Zn-dependent protease